MNELDIDFSMDTSSIVNEVGRSYEVCVSMTLLVFHGTTVLTIVIVMLAVIV